MRKNLRWPPTVVWPLKKSCCCFEKEMREKVFLRAEEPHREAVCVLEAAEYRAAAAASANFGPLIVQL